MTVRVLHRADRDRSGAAIHGGRDGIDRGVPTGGGNRAELDAPIGQIEPWIVVGGELPGWNHQVVTVLPVDAVRCDRDPERGVLSERDVGGLGTDQPRDLSSNPFDVVTPCRIEPVVGVVDCVLLHCLRHPQRDRPNRRMIEMDRCLRGWELSARRDQC